MTARSLSCCRRGGPMLEFALICPVLAIMVMGIFDLTEALITIRRVTLASQEVVEAAATFAATSAAIGTISSSQAMQAMSIAQAVLPQLLASGTPAYGIALSSVVMVPSPANCTSGCTYTAQTVWSTNIDNGQTLLRPCGVLQSVPNTQPASLTTLPAGLFYPPAILVADVSTVYTPTFSMFFSSPITMMRSAYMPPRGLGSSSYVGLTVNGSYSGSKCSGYP